MNYTKPSLSYKKASAKKLPRFVKSAQIGENFYILSLLNIKPENNTVVGVINTVFLVVKSLN